MDDAFYDRTTDQVARDLLGGILSKRDRGRWIGGVIVETEAYLSTNDPASHSHRGLTPSNTSMFGPPGSIYVYPIHAKHCINVVTQASGTGSAVLIRALQPIWGTSLMKRRRNSHDDRKWTSGPGMICQSLGIDRRHDGIDPEVDPKWCLMPGPATGLVNKISITTTPRIGVSQAKELPLRFFVDGNRYVSGRAADHKRPRRETLKISEAALRRFGFLLS